MDFWITLITLWLGATVKFAVGYPSAIGALHLNFLEAMLFGVSSGVAGCYFFVYAGDWFLDRVVKLIPKKKKKGPPKKIFTKRTRRLIYIKNRYGLIGLALITPTIISIPVGCLISTRFFHNKKTVMLHMSASVFVWSLVIYPFIHLIRSAF